MNNLAVESGSDLITIKINDDKCVILDNENQLTESEEESEEEYDEVWKADQYPMESKTETDAPVSVSMEKKSNENDKPRKEIEGNRTGNNIQFENVSPEKKGKEIPEYTHYHAVKIRKERKYSSALDDSYDMQSFYPRGRVLMFSIVNFENPDWIRKGAVSDANILCALFQDLGFDIDRFNDPKKEKVIDELEKFMISDFSKYGCSVMIFLSHGEANGVYAKDKLVTYAEIREQFCKQNLNGKPKLLFFNACRGKSHMPNQKEYVDSNKKSSLALDLPIEKDCLYAYSTVMNFVSTRHTLEGSWFVDDIVSVFRAHAHEYDINNLLTLVNKKVSERVPKAGDDVNTRQVSSFVNQLTKSLYFFPPKGSISKVPKAEKKNIKQFPDQTA